MSSSRVTSKGQVTIPVEVREALGIEQGDALVFEVSSNRTAHLRVVKGGTSLSDLYGALPATRSFPGTATIREHVGQELGRKAKRS